jgi:integrase
MKTRYRLIRRGIRGGAFYCVDANSGKRTSLGSATRDEAEQIVSAKNQAERQPVLNLQIAKAYLLGADSGFSSRTWRHAIEILTGTKKGANKARWERVAKDKALQSLFPKILIETSGEFLFQVLAAGTVSTNVFLRRLHNFCVDMNWLPVPLIPKRSWPSVRYKDKRAITEEEHLRIVEREKNPERRAFYQMAWHLGSSQSDLANLLAEDINWDDRIICFERLKTRWRGQQPPQIRFGEEVEAILAELPKKGHLFPYLATVRESDRATEFAQRCERLGITGITLHSYRYAWAERAKVCGYPERFAQLALGHNSKAVHRAYAKKARVTLPPLEEYERSQVDGNVIPLRRKKHVLPSDEHPSEKDLATA